MELDRYQWKPIREGEIRLVTLIPGPPKSPLKISIHSVRLEEPDVRRLDRRLSLVELEATLPPGWVVAQTHQYQHQFLFEDSSEHTSWEHPDPAADPAWWEPYPEVPPQGYEPKYEALSYVCGLTGSEDPSVDISVSDANGDQQIRVGCNLAAALEDLRYEGKDRILWIDALSIDQQNVAERAYQVMHISKVYRWAWRVVIWLGPATETSPKAVSTLANLGSQLEVGSDHRRYCSPGATEKDWFRSTCSLDFPESAWEAIERLFQREWWERLWVWQESQLANSRAIVLVGHGQVTWQCLRKALICLRTKDNLPPSRLSLRERLQLIEKMTLERSSISLNLVLNATRDRKCLDPKDKIYGILSIAGEILSHDITPDYTDKTSAADVYREVFVAYTKQTQRLDLLASCEFLVGNRTANLPSWVPDMNVARRTDSLLPFQLVSGISSAEATFDDKILRAVGMDAGGVGTVYEPFALNDNQAFKDLRALYFKWVADEYQTASILDALMRTIRVGYFDDSWTNFAAPTFDDWKTEFLDAMITEHRPTDATFDWCLRLIKGRRIFRTLDGRVGLSPRETCKGDIICILLGCKAPLIVRPEALRERLSNGAGPAGAWGCDSSADTGIVDIDQVDQRYEVIGECYIDGLENGLLGNLPSGWKLQFDKIKSGYGATHTFIHTESATKTKWHPSLGSMPQQWTSFDRERRPADPSTFVCFRNTLTGEERNSDPRLTAERLRDQGIAIKTFTFI